MILHVKQVQAGHDKFRSMEAEAAPRRGDSATFHFMHGDVMRGHVEHVHWTFDTVHGTVVEIRLTTVPGKQTDIHTNPRDVIRSQTP